MFKFHINQIFILDMKQQSIWILHLKLRCKTTKNWERKISKTILKWSEHASEVREKTITQNWLENKGKQTIKTIFHLKYIQ